MMDKNIIAKSAKMLRGKTKKNAKEMTMIIGKQWDACNILLMEFLNYNLNILFEFKPI